MSSKIPNTSPPKMYHQIYIYLDAVSPHVIQARACIKFFSILIPSRLLMLITISVLRSQITFTPSPIHSFCSSLVWLLSQPHIFDHSSQLSTWGSSEAERAHSPGVWSNHLLCVGGPSGATSQVLQLFFLGKPTGLVIVRVSPPQRSLSNYVAACTMRDSMPDLIRGSQCLLCSV